MRRVTVSQQRWLERWRPRAFLIAGGLLIASPATKAVAVFTDGSLPVWLVVLLVFPGLLVALAGTLGMYPQLADETPRLAFVGVTVTAVAGGAVALLFTWILVSSVIPASGGVVDTAPPGLVFLSVMSLTAMGFVLSGVASLRSASLSRSTGLLLLSFAVPWIVILAVTPVYGSDLPGWVALAVYGPMPIVLLATGFRLRSETPWTDRDTPPSTLPTG